jgi:hypothetical protein
VIDVAYWHFSDMDVSTKVRFAPKADIRRDNRHGAAAPTLQVDDLLKPGSVAATKSILYRQQSAAQ